MSRHLIYYVSTKMCHGGMEFDGNGSMFDCLSIELLIENPKTDVKSRLVLVVKVE